MHNKIGLTLESEGDATTNTTTKIAKYNEAISHFNDAERITTDQAKKTFFIHQKATVHNKIDKIPQELDVAAREAESLGDAATDTEIKIAKYNEAISHFNDAENIIKDQSKKYMFFWLPKDYPARESYNSRKEKIYNKIDNTYNKIGNALLLEGDAATDTGMKLERYQEAITKFDEAAGLIRDQSQKSRYINKKASVYNKIDKIQRELDVAGREAKSLGDAITNTTTKIAKYNEAIAKFNDAERITTYQAKKTLYNNNKADTHNKIGDALLLEGNTATDISIKKEKYQEAIIAFDEAISIKPDYVEAHNKKGTVLGIIARYEDAISSFDEAIRIDPGNTDAINGKEEARESINKLTQEADSIGELIAGNISKMDDCIDYINRDIINFDSEDKNNPIWKIRDLNTNLPEIRELILSVEGELKSNISKRDTIISILNNNGINYENKIISNQYEGIIEDLINSIDKKENEFNLEISDREEVARQEAQDWEKIDTGHDYNDLSLLLGDLDGGYIENH